MTRVAGPGSNCAAAATNAPPNFICAIAAKTVAGRKKRLKRDCVA
jgi:hypothetical protein